jgi:hypothetical protein
VSYVFLSRREKFWDEPIHALFIYRFHDLALLDLSWPMVSNIQVGQLWSVILSLTQNALKNEQSFDTMEALHEKTGIQICRKRLLSTKSCRRQPMKPFPVAQGCCCFLSEKLFHQEWESNPQSSGQAVTLPSFWISRYRLRIFARAKSELRDIFFSTARVKILTRNQR